MAKTGLTDISANNTFQVWLDRTNDLIEIMKTDVITASSLGDDTGLVSNPKIANLFGSFSANTITAVDQLKAGNIQTVSGSTNITISSPSIIDTTQRKSLELFSNVQDPVLRFNNNLVAWDAGFSSEETGSFTITTGSSSELFKLNETGSLTLSGSLTLGELNDESRIRLNNPYTNEFQSHAFISKSFDGPALTADGRGIATNGPSGAIESVVDQTDAYFLWCSYGGIDNFIGGIRPNSTGTGIEIVGGVTSTTITSPTIDVSQLSVTDRMRVKYPLNAFTNHAFISNSGGTGPAVTARGKGIGLSGAFESVVDETNSYFLWCSYDEIDSNLLGGIRPNSNASGTLFRSGLWDAGKSDSNNDFIINYGNFAPEEFKLSASGQLSISGDARFGTNGNNKRIRLNNDFNSLFSSHAFISRSFDGPALTADGRDVADNGAAGAIESVVNQTNAYFLWCSYGGIDNFIGGIKPDAGANGIFIDDPSDYRLKENVTDLKNASERLRRIPVRSFNFKGCENTIDGFIAHEVQQEVPEAVTGDKDEIDENGNPIYQGVDKSKLVPLLTATVQELLSKIDDLESRIVSLEG